MTDVNLSFDEVRKMRRGTNSYEVFPFPFMDDVYVGMRVLTQDETVKAVNVGRAKAKTELENPTEDEELKYSSRELLFTSVVKATNDTSCSSEPFFSSAEQVGELTLDELNLLLEHYNEVQQKYVPQQDLKTPEEFDALIADLKKKPQTGMSLSTYTLRMLSLYMVAKLTNWQNDSDSTSSSASQSNPTEKETLTPKQGRKGLKILDSNT